jgi:phospholipid/cholesterol/gamma-HCH transport system permease protein
MDNWRLDGETLTRPIDVLGAPRRLGLFLLGLIGWASLLVSRQVGSIALLAWGIVRAVLTGRTAWRDVVSQVYTQGVQSIPLVIVTAILSGVVTSQQGGYQLTSSIPLYVLGSIVTSSIILELGPVMTTIVMIGRVGARITAELGTMKVSEQIDALQALGRDPVAVLGAPRVLAGVVSMPLLVGIADLVGFLSGMVAARAGVGLGYESFLHGARLYWHNWDLFYSLMKAVVFGFTFPLIAVQMGLRTRGGAEGVGRSTTRSVVLMIVTVLVLDAIFPPLLLN